VPPTLDHPRPHFLRERWSSLNGPWRFATSTTSDPDQVAYDRDIIVPFPPEAPLSGLHDEAYHERVWYQRSFEIPDAWRSGRLLLHFGAVDYHARVWVNGKLVATHEGGHTPFHADITDVLVAGSQTVTVCADDDPHDMQLPRGKQDWLPEPHGIWYPRTTGIWQSVWLEPLASAHIGRVRFTPDLPSFSIGTEVQVAGTQQGHLHVEVRHGERVLVADRWQLAGKRIARTLTLPDPGIDNARQTLLWSPEHPTLLDVTLRLEVAGVVVDEVHTYTALRSVEARDGYFHLNGRPYPLRLVLDQGYWTEGLMTAPSGEALRRDVELTKALGFNGVRKHQKIEDPRFLFWADTLGLLVWEELPSAYAFGPDAVQRLTRVWLEAIERDYNHPCIVTWVAFNESWGVPDLPNDARQRHAVAALYHLTKSLDATRLVVGNDGWEHVVTDLITLHDYSRDPATLAERYGSDTASRYTALQVIEHGRVGMLDPEEERGQPVILSEFGGIRYHPASVGWGYQQVENPADLLRIYAEMIRALPLRGVAGFCYTQLTDTFQEQNGLLFADRQPKAELSALSQATHGKGA
jgi:beta-galactosidase/beta-glucuronidase